ncbi:Uncharacterized protein GBIM_02934 [Gryllus bimaculatus]|nr:Uncharacterized protein GBIM_02934 [Gryllus bimaculatus]
MKRLGSECPIDYGHSARRIAGPMPGEKVLDYWEPSRGMLSNADAFMQSLLNFDKESVTDQKQKQLQPYIDDPNFQPAKILAVSDQT